MRSVLAAVVRLVISALARTWRVELVGADHLRRLRNERSAFIFAVWHRSLIPLVWWHRHQDITLLVSAHGDGDLLARAARRWGYRLVRGSSTRGGGVALRLLVRALQAGAEVAVTPDGPRGPARRAKPGTLAAARRAGVPILPVAADASRSWVIKSWDGLIVPRPFARVRIVYQVPLPADVPNPDLAVGLDRAADAAGEARAA